MSDKSHLPPEVESLRQAYLSALRGWTGEIERLGAEVARLTAENERLRAATQWQTIDVEPSHAMRVVLLYPDSFEPLFDGATYAVEAAYFMNGQWLEIGTNHSAFEYDTPTHWMPLPTPPEGRT